MSVFPINILLAISWAAFTADFSLRGLTIGFVIGYAALWIAQPLFNRTDPYFLRVWRILRLIVMFLYELVISSVAVVWDVLTPQHHSSPAMIAVPLDVESEAEVLLVTSLISLTPGTLSVDLSPDGKTLLVHAMFGDDPDALCKSLKNGMERWVKEAFE